MTAPAPKRPPPTTPVQRLICHAWVASGLPTLSALAASLAPAVGTAPATVGQRLSGAIYGRAPLPAALEAALRAVVGRRRCPEELDWPARHHPTCAPRLPTTADGRLIARAQRRGKYATRRALAAAVGIDPAQLSRVELSTEARARLEAIAARGAGAAAAWGRAAESVQNSGGSRASRK